MNDNEYWDAATEQAYWDACAQEEAARREKDMEPIPRGAARNLAYGIFNHFMQTDFLSITPLDIDEKVDAIPVVPHEMSAVEYIREYRRMHSFYFGKPATDGGMNGCGDCPGRLNGKKNCIFSPTRDESSIPIVEEWARKHPEKKRKTYVEDFFSKYPDAPHSTKNGMTTDRPAACRMVIYGGWPLCIATKCDCAACWNEEMEDADE